MPDSETNPDSKPRVSSEAINTAYKLEAFIESGHQYGLALSNELIDTISYITNKYKDPSPTRDHSTAACNGQKTRQGRSLGIEPLQDPSSWAIDRPAYTKSLKAFVDQINKIRRYSKTNLNKINNSLNFGNRSKAKLDETNDSLNLPDQIPKSCSNTGSFSSKFDYGTGDVIDKGKEWYYRNVHSFVARVRVAAATRDATTLRQNLDLCLKGEAQDWWTNQLSHVTRVGIMADNNGVEEWVKALEKQFREAPSVALEPSEYVTAIATAAKGCGQGDTEFTQVLHAFCGIDSNLRHFGIDEPEERTTIQEFINLLNRKKVNWFNHYAQNEQKENKERRDQCRNIKQDCDRSQERLNQRGNRNQGQYQNSPMYQPIVPCQALNQISQPYGSNNQQQGFDQGFNQGRSYSQGYNLGGAQV
ncbi:hypothetical protein LPUS_02723 [Lasallia pustulata]|uniref:Uncharacterized protein n=1 Tax=Lasallia pustulata TaxID=136370 RepID=A0A1W5CTB4_9LECA|nr:hypothetical protein LPUS_02723 [Lasallia pustulata]